MRKCLLKLFSLLQKRVPATITQISKSQRSELIFPSIRLPVFLNMDNSWKSTLRRLFMVGGIDYQVQLMAIWHNSKPKTQFFFRQQWEQYTGWGKRGEAYSATILQKTEVSNCVLSTGVHFRSLRCPSSTLQTIPLSLFGVLRWSLEIHILGLDSGGKKLHFKIYWRHIRWTIFTVCARWTFGNLRGEAPHSILGNLVQFCPNFLGEITIIWTGRQWRTSDSCGLWGKTHFGRRCQ